MKIIIDEYPKLPKECSFSRMVSKNVDLCSFDDETCSVEFCPYLISLEEGLLKMPKRTYDIKD